MATPTLVSSSRQRTRRACDHCRRRKTKCDGQLSCEPCFDNGLQCSYGHQTKRSSGTKYIARLEQKLKQLQTEAHKTLPNTSATGKGSVTGLDKDLDYSSLNLPALVTTESLIPELFNHGVKATGTPSSGNSDEDLGEAPGIDLGEYTTHCGDTTAIYRGKTTGVEIVRDLRRLCGSFLGLQVDPDNAALKMANALDSCFPICSLSTFPSANLYFSSETSIRRWTNIAFSQAFVLWPFIDRELFDLHLERLLGQGISGRNRCDSDYLGLLHAVIALGQRHDAELIDKNDKEVPLSDIPGIHHFEAARELVPLMKCSRSITAVQTVLCMALYSKSIAAQRTVHTYVSMAGYAAHQLGLHEAASHCLLSEKERVVRQRVYVALRMFDAYVTCSLGLPRSLRALRPAEEFIDAPHIEKPEMLLAANANVELLEILGDTREKVHMTNTFTRAEGLTGDESTQLQDLSDALDRWGQKYPVFARVTDESLAVCTKVQLFLRYSQCFVLLELYLPFVQHFAKPQEIHSPSAYTYASKCVEVAISAVRTAEALDAREMLYEAYALTIDVLAMAATTLLVVELGTPLDTMAEIIKKTSLDAKVLLENLAHKNCSAAKCLESLAPLYVIAARSTPSFGTSIGQSRQSFNISPQASTESPSIDPELAEGSQALASTIHPQAANYNSSISYQQDSLVKDTLNFPVLWSNWESDGYANYTQSFGDLWADYRSNHLYGAEFSA